MEIVFEDGEVFVFNKRVNDGGLCFFEVVDLDGDVLLLLI